LRLATSSSDAFRLILRNSFRLDRLRLPRATSEEKVAILRSNDEATVKLVPTGLLISCATPATSRPRAASFSASIKEFWVSCRFPQGGLGHVPGTVYLLFACVQRSFGALALGDFFGRYVGETAQRKTISPPPRCNWDPLTPNVSPSVRVSLAVCNLHNPSTRYQHRRGSCFLCADRETKRLSSRARRTLHKQTAAQNGRLSVFA
jgi:hypothetical protein